MIGCSTAATPKGPKASIALTERVLSYNLQVLSLHKQQQKSTDFFKTNPNGRIAAIVDHAHGNIARVGASAISAARPALEKSVQTLVRTKADESSIHTAQTMLVR